MKFVIFLFLTLSSSAFAATAPARLPVICPPKMAEVTSPKDSPTHFMTEEDDKEFSDFLTANGSLFRGILRGFFKNQDTIDDVFQIGSLKLYRNWKKYSDIGYKKTAWAGVVFKRSALNYNRDNKVWNNRIDETGSSAIDDSDDTVSVLDRIDAAVAIAEHNRGRSALDDLIRKQDTLPIFAAIDGLPPRQKRAMQLYYFGESGPSSIALFKKNGAHEQGQMWYEEIAEAMETTVSTVKALLHRGNKSVTKALNYFNQFN